MKKRLTAAALAALFMLSGCDALGGVISNNPPVEVSDSERAALTKKLKYLPLTEILYGVDMTDEQVDALDAQFTAKEGEYDAVLNTALGERQAFCETTFMKQTTVPELSSYSPLTSVLYKNSTAIGINPVVLADLLTEGARVSSSTAYTGFTPEHDYSINAPKVYENRNDLIREALSTYISPDTDFSVTYYKSENLYCVNFVTAEKDLLVSAMYFHFSDDGTLDRGGMDQVIYTGRELLLSDPAHAADAALSFTDGDYTRYESPCSANALSSVIIRLLGSAVSDERMVRDADIKASESYRTDRIGDTDAIKGIHIVSWFEIGKTEEPAPAVPATDEATEAPEAEETPAETAAPEEVPEPPDIQQPEVTPELPEATEAPGPAADV